jgi:pimeloyl-ACP methyl ester carboxylesterase
MSLFHRRSPFDGDAAQKMPDLPPGFADTFSSRYVDTGDVRLHAVIGGDGPPLLLVHGWPESWYAWRHVMPALARDFEVVAVDQRGMGHSDKPLDGYDTRTQANDLVALMRELGHETFALVGHDTGFAISYAVAADHPESVERVALLEIPGSPGAAPAPPVFVPGQINDRLWHLPFNRLERINEQQRRHPGHGPLPRGGVARPAARRADAVPGAIPRRAGDRRPASHRVAGAAPPVRPAPARRAPRACGPGARRPGATGKRCTCRRCGPATDARGSTRR